MSEIRTPQDFVENLLSDGKDANYIRAIAANTYWKPRLAEVFQVIESFSPKLKKRFTDCTGFSR